MYTPVTVNKFLPNHLELFSSFLLAFSMLFLMSHNADAQTKEPQLIENVVVSGHLVLLADLVKNAGIKGHIPIFRAPNPGTTGNVSASRIISAARTHGLTVSRIPTFAMITIKRTSRIIELEELKDLVRGRLEEKLSEIEGKGQLVIKLPDDLKQLHVDQSVQGELSLSSLDWSQRSGRFTARFQLVGADPIILKGTVSLMVEVSVARSIISRGHIISPSDIEMKYIKLSRRGQKPIATMEDLIGLSAKRRLQAGQQITKRDLEIPVLIRKNQLVTILLESPGLILRTEGKALADAIKGESLKVLNTQTKRIIHATAKSSGLVSVKLVQLNGSAS